MMAKQLSANGEFPAPPEVSECSSLSRGYSLVISPGQFRREWGQAAGAYGGKRQTAATGSFLEAGWRPGLRQDAADHSLGHTTEVQYGVGPGSTPSAATTHRLDERQRKCVRP